MAISYPEQHSYPTLPQPSLPCTPLLPHRGRPSHSTISLRFPLVYWVSPMHATPSQYWGCATHSTCQLARWFPDYSQASSRLLIFPGARRFPAHIREKHRPNPIRVPWRFLFFLRVETASVPKSPMFENVLTEEQRIKPSQLSSHRYYDS